MFTEQERRIFPYFDGANAVYADPIAVRRKLVHELGGDLDQALADYRSEIEAVAYEATESLLAATRTALSMVPFDAASGTGATDDQVLAALAAFLDFEEAKKKSVPTSSTPTSSPPSPRGPSPLAGPSTRSTPAGLPGSDCGCG